MAETTIDFVKGEDFLLYFSDIATEIKYMKTLIGQEGIEVMFDYTDGEDGGLELKVPKKWYKKPRPPKKGGRTWTEEEKKANADRLAKWREENKKGKNE